MPRRARSSSTVKVTNLFVERDHKGRGLDPKRITFPHPQVEETEGNKEGSEKEEAGVKSAATRSTAMRACPH